MLNKILIVISSLLLCSCGGGGGSSNNAVIYSFVTPSVNSQSNYAVSTSDTLSNTINQSYIDKITSVNTDGSYSMLKYDPSNNTVLSGVVDYSIYATTITANNVGQITSVTYTPTNHSAVNCTYSPHNAAIPSPLSLGQTWSFDFVRSCNGVDNSFSVSGKFVASESISIPLGAFNSYKFQYSIIETMASGLTITDDVIVWTDASRVIPRFLKQTVNRTYSGGTPVSGSLTSQTTILQSYQ
jgi:hypothetical protein